jgi:hypothetical protein
MYDSITVENQPALLMDDMMDDQSFDDVHNINEADDVSLSEATEDSNLMDDIGNRDDMELDN